MTSHKIFGRTIKNGVFNSGSWVLVLALNILATPYLVRKLTPEVYGLMAIMNGILGYLTIVDFSFRDALIKYMAEDCAKGRFAEARRVFNTVLVFQSLIGVACMLLLIALAKILLGWFNVKDILMPVAYKSYITMCIGFPISLVAGIYASLPVALQRFDVSASLGTVVGSITIIGSVIIVALGYNLPEIMLWNVIVLGISVGLYHSWMLRACPWFGISWTMEKAVIQQLFGFSFFSQMAKSASMVNDQFLRIIVGSLLGPTAVTYYAVPLRLINGLQGLIDKVAKVMFPLASEMSAANDYETLKRGYLLVAKYLCVLVTPIYFVLAIYARDIMTIWIGREFAEKSWVVLTLSAVTYWLISWTMVPSNVAFGLGRAKINAYFAIGVAAANLVLTYFFCRQYGINGAALAVLCTQIQTPVFVVIVSNHFGAGFGMRLLREAYLIPAALGLLLLALGLCVLHEAHSPIHRIFLGSCGIIAYYALAVISGIVPIADVKRLRTSLR